VIENHSWFQIALYVVLGLTVIGALLKVLRVVSWTWANILLPILTIAALAACIATYVAVAIAYAGITGGNPFL
jgi:hypothetical protein